MSNLQVVDVQVSEEPSSHRQSLFCVQEVSLRRCGLCRVAVQPRQRVVHVPLDDDHAWPCAGLPSGPMGTSHGREGERRVEAPCVPAEAGLLEQSLQRCEAVVSLSQRSEVREASALTTKCEDSLPRGLAGEVEGSATGTHQVHVLWDSACEDIVRNFAPRLEERARARLKALSYPTTLLPRFHVCRKRSDCSLSLARRLRALLGGPDGRGVVRCKRTAFSLGLARRPRAALESPLGHRAQSTWAPSGAFLLEPNNSSLRSTSVSNQPLLKRFHCPLSVDNDWNVLGFRLTPAHRFFWPAVGKAFQVLQRRGAEERGRSRGRLSFAASRARCFNGCLLSEGRRSVPPQEGGGGSGAGLVRPRQDGEAAASLWWAQQNGKETSWKRNSQM